MTNVFSIILPILVAFVVTAIATPLCLPIIKRLGLIDDPKTHKHPAMIHTKPTPRGGGIPLFLGVFIAGIFFLPITKVTIMLFLASLLALVIGTLDDKYDLSRYTRLGINIVCAILVVGGGVGIPFITNPFGGVIHLDTLHFTFSFFGKHTIFVISDLLALFWIVWVMNMLNWSKGVDGQMPGVVAISAFVIGILSLRFTGVDPLSTVGATIAFLVTGACLGFLIYNFYPAKIFPGYGATAIYLLVAAVAILSTAKLATAVLVMGVPLLDGSFTILRRILSGRSPFWGDKKHLHHLLLGIGFGQRRIALSYALFSAIVGTLALVLSSKGKLVALFILAIVVLGGITILHITQREK